MVAYFPFLGVLTTAVELDIPVVFILFNNFSFSTIRTLGSSYFQNTFMLMAKAFGIESALVEEPDGLAAALTKAIAAESSHLLEVRTRGMSRCRARVTGILRTF